MKKCTKCKKELPISEFPIVNKKINKISAKCIDCKREYDREYWGKIKLIKGKRKNDLAQQNRRSKRKFIIDLLKKSKCIDCGNADWRVLEFDHLNRATKKFNIAGSTEFSIETIKKEIDKCEIVCANCHRIRTILQRGYYNF